MTSIMIDQWSEKDEQQHGPVVLHNDVNLPRQLDNPVDIGFEDKDGYTPLLLAVQRKDVERAERLVELGADVHHKDLEGWSALHWASIHGLTRLVKILTEKGADVNCRNLEEKTPLMLSCDNGTVETVELLLHLGAELEAEDTKGRTPLIWAVYRKWPKVVDLLIRSGADVTHVDIEGQNALYYSLDVTMCKKLLKPGLDINHQDKIGRSLLYKFCEVGNISIVDFLLSFEGADPNIANNDGFTPLMLASKFRYTEIVKLLLRSAADVSPVENTGMSARDIAELKGNTDVIALLPPKCPRSVFDEMQSTFRKKQKDIFEAIGNGDNSQITSLLDINMSNGPWGITPLLRCIVQKNCDGAEILLSSGAKVNLSNTIGITPLMKCAKSSNTQLLNSLLTVGADIRLRDSSGKTALMYAAQHGQQEIIDFLLLEGANINTQQTTGMTALMHAAKSGHLSVVNCLLANEAQTTLRSKWGETGLHLSLEKNHMEIAKQLLEVEKLESTKSEDGKMTIHYLAELGKTDIMKILLGLNVDVNVQDKAGMSPLMLSACNGHVDLLRCLIDNKADVNKVGKDGKTALNMAVAKMDQRTVEMLLKAGAETDISDDRDITPLHYACVLGDLDILTALKDKGANVNRMTSDYNTPLHLAVLAGHTNVAQTLAVSGWFTRGAKLDLTDGEDRTVLMMAASKGNSSLVSFLLDETIDVNIRDRRGWTALMFCAQHGFTEIMEDLMNHGADLGLTCSSGGSPLSIAAANGHKKAVRLLLDNGSDMNCKDENGYTPMMLAACNGHEEIIVSYLAYGPKLQANLELQCNSGDTLLGICCIKGFPLAVRLLLEKGANVNSRNKQGYSPIMLATCNNNLDIVICLLQRNPDLQFADFKKGNTVLHIASEKGFEQIGLILLREKVDLNKKNQLKLTPLHLGAFHGHRTIVEEIVHQGASLDVRDNDGNTALMLSVSNNNHDVAKCLIDGGAQTGLKNKLGKTALDLSVEFGFSECVELFLATGLCRQTGAQSLKGNDKIATESGDAQGEAFPTDVNIVLSGERLQVTVEHCSQQFFQANRSDSYSMENNPRGLALIVNVYQVVGSQPRVGTDIDRDNLQALFTQLNFHVIVYNDGDGLSAVEIKRKVREFSTHWSHAMMEACVVCVLSHGTEGYIDGTDGERVKLSEIFDMFDNKNCQALIDKPKIFIIQACRGHLTDAGVTWDEADVTVEPSKMPETSDMLKCFPTQTFYQAFRNTTNGSWFIEAIVKTFMKYAKCEDMCAMMHRVNDVVSRRLSRHTDPQQAGKMQMSEYVSTLRKPHLYLFPGIPGIPINNGVL